MKPLLVFLAMFVGGLAITAAVASAFEIAATEYIHAR